MTGFTRNQLTSESKALLRKTVRGLRESLIEQLKESAQQRYLLTVPLQKAKLGAEAREYRRRLEEALDQAEEEEGGGKEARERAFELAARQAGATFLNRLVLIRHLEALGLSKPAVLTGGWMSKGYREFQSVAGALCADETQGMWPLLELLFAELAVPLPGLFGEVGLSKLFPISPATLRQVIEELDKIPADAWSDDLTLGWVYQFWNDPDREALDAKIAASGKIEPHELASKTQMFTERYMVEWLLQNSLGVTWLAMCKKKGWTPEAESSGTLARLDARRAEWRKKREAGEVAPDALMPIESRLEDVWKYYVPQPMPAAVVEHAPDSLQELKLLDPACGSGHFLVVAFDLLVELYREEGRHLGEQRSDRQIAEWILEKNLHGIDIDPRAVQLAAAGLYLKANALSKDADPRQVNLVAPSLKLAALKENDPGLVKLETDIEHETGIPPQLTREIIQTLAGVDHLGSLLKVGDAIEKALEKHEGAFSRQLSQAELFTRSGVLAQSERRRSESSARVSRDAAKKIVLKRIEGLLSRHATGEDLGLRLRGQQLSAGLRFATIANEGAYHLVVGNPPYQATSRLRQAKYVSREYRLGKSDLYAAFLERGAEFCRANGALAFVTMRNWMFASSFSPLRKWLLSALDLRLICDVDRGGFDEVANDILAAAMSVFRRSPPAVEQSVAIQPNPLSDKSYDRARTARKRAAVLSQAARFNFSSRLFSQIDGEPLLYWWSQERIEDYSRCPKVAQIAQGREGLGTKNDPRYLRYWWEVPRKQSFVAKFPTHARLGDERWVPFVKGADGRRWFEPLTEVIDWDARGLRIATFKKSRFGRGAKYYFQCGVAVVTKGTEFSARLHRFSSVFGHAGTSFFSDSPDKLVCLLNSEVVREAVESFNPGLSFQLADVKRAPVLALNFEREIMAVLSHSFDEHERRRETSIEFECPGVSTWRSAQVWAKAVLDRRSNSGSIPPFVPKADEPDAFSKLSFAVGTAIGRFGEGPARSENAGGGLLWVSECTGVHGVAAPLLEDAWRLHGQDTKASSLSDWLRTQFFEEHRQMYASRPVYLPLSSSRRSFVVFVHIHSWRSDTLERIVAEFLLPERKIIQGWIEDALIAKRGAVKEQRDRLVRQLSARRKWVEELDEFVASIMSVAEKGPPPAESKGVVREDDAVYEMHLADGVLVNSAALWPLLQPMWKEPRKWWGEISTALARDCDWSLTARRYFPTRVEEKCKKDPSLAVAHGCFWKYHPEVAYQWELRLQDEIGPDFRIDEKDSDALRKKFLKDHKQRAAELEAAERVRRERKAAKQDQEELELDAADDSAGDDESDAA